MDGNISIKYLQSYIKLNERFPDTEQGYLMKLTEELGELSAAIIRGKKAKDPDEIKGTLDEELFDVLYYIMAMANRYDIDMERLIRVKTAMNEMRYPSGAKFEEGR